MKPIFVRNVFVKPNTLNIWAKLPETGHNMEDLRYLFEDKSASTNRSPKEERKRMDTAPAGPLSAGESTDISIMFKGFPK